MKEEGDNKEKEVKRGKGGWYIGGVWWGDKGGKKGTDTERRREKDTPYVVVFIPHIPQGILKNRLQEKDKKMMDAMGMRRVKFVERGKKSLQGIL